jgi:biopolymer transport protein ExbB
MLTERLLQFSLIGAEWVLWLLIALSAVSMTLLADRAILFLRTREGILRLEPALMGALARGDLPQAQKEVSRDSLVRNVLRAGLDQVVLGRRDPGSVEQAMLGALARERARYEARLIPIATIGNNAPFVGLFGTVLGIIQAFNQLGKMDASMQAASNQLVMSAIGEALIATAVGILVAIPAVAAYNWAKANIGDRLKQAESLMRAVLAGLGALPGPCDPPRAEPEKPSAVY